MPQKLRRVGSTFVDNLKNGNQSRARSVEKIKNITLCSLCCLKRWWLFKLKGAEVELQTNTTPTVVRITHQALLAYLSARLNRELKIMKLCRNYMGNLALRLKKASWQRQFILKFQSIKMWWILKLKWILFPCHQIVCFFLIPENIKNQHIWIVKLA